MEFKSYDEEAEDEWGGLMDVIAARKRDAESDTRPPGTISDLYQIMERPFFLSRLVDRRPPYLCMPVSMQSASVDLC